VYWSVLVLAVAAGSVGGWFALKSGGPNGSGPAPRPAAPPAPAEEEALTLPEAEREYIWTIEHHGLLLKKYGIKPLGAALQRRDAPALTKMLPPDFQGQVVQKPRTVSLSADFAAVVRQEDVADQPRQTLNRDEFVARLLDYRRQFAAPPGIDFGLITLAPVTRGQMDGPWTGSGQLRLFGQMLFNGVQHPEVLLAATQLGLAGSRFSALLPPAPPGEIMLSLQFRLAGKPEEEPLKQDGWLHSCTITQATVGRAQRYLLEEVAAVRGIDTSFLHDNWVQKPLQPVTGGIYLCDFDRDGYLDMLITDVNGIALYRGQPGGKFIKVNLEEIGLPSRASHTAAAFVDLDGDGWEDLILGDRVYQNVSDGKKGRRFTDVTYMTNLRIPYDTSGIVVADYDRDGLMDVYITRPGLGKAGSWIDGKSGDKRGNQLWHNKGNWYFEDVTTKSGTAGGQRSVFSAVWLDANNDGWPDLYVPNEFGNGVLLLNNQDGTFREHMIMDGPCDFGSMGITCGDIDNDGNIDLYLANMYSKAGARVMSNVSGESYPPEIMARMRRFVTGSQLHLNRGNLKFEHKGQEYGVASVGWAYGACLVDLDNDGWLDLYATAGYVSVDRSEPDG
jgi:hypothetical protein